MVTITLKDERHTAAQQQLEELECMLSMFPNEEEMVIDWAAKSALEKAIADDDKAATLPRIQFTFHYKDLRFGRETPALTLTCPQGYPEEMPMLFEVKCPQLSRVEMENLNSELEDLAATACAAQEIVGLQLYQHMHDFLSQVQSVSDERDRGDADGNADKTLTPMVLGRRAIYFHHIIACNKRRVVKEWALELHLGGFSKIGWPGVVIVEGSEDNVQEYVRRLQHLRWKQMTVRGEQTEELGEEDPREIDALRRLRGFHEFPENGMSDLAAACRAVGLEELFLTTMKIYGRSEDKEREESGQVTAT